MAMAMSQQVLVRLVSGGTRCLHFDGDVSCEAIKGRVCEIEGIPRHLQRIVTGTRQLGDGDLLQRGRDGVLPNCTVLLRLRGGKGGFGSLLRGAATGGRHKKTSNFDACRDMSGRRLRHVNAEKKLKEWTEEAPLRELEKVAEKYLRNESRKRKTESDIAEDLMKFREQTEKNMEEVQAAVMDGLMMHAKKLGTDGKRKKVEPLKTEAKKIKLAFEEDSDADDDEDLFNEPLFGSSSGASTSSSQGEDVEAPSAEDEERNAENDADTENVAEDADEDATVAATFQSPAVHTDVADANIEVASKVVDQQQMEVREENAKKPKPLNLDGISSVQELEALGLEKLKLELQQRGLKCGGSLRERAARLFLLKTTPIDKLDKKHFAKAK